MILPVDVLDISNDSFFLNNKYFHTKMNCILEEVNTGADTNASFVWIEKTNQLSFCHLVCGEDKREKGPNEGVMLEYIRQRRHVSLHEPVKNS